MEQDQGKVRKPKQFERISDNDFLVHFSKDMDFTQCVEDMLHLAEKYNLSYQSDVQKFIKQLNIKIKSIVLISKMDALSGKYHTDEKYLKAVSSISPKYPFQMNVRADGNSFYRAFMLSYIITLILNQNASQLTQFIKQIISIDSTNFKHKKVQSHKRNVEYIKSFLITFLFECLIECLYPEQFNLVKFIKRYNSVPIVDFALVVFSKHIILQNYQNILENPEHKSLVDHSNSDKIVNYLKSYGLEADEYIIPLAAYAFNVDLVIQNLFKDQNKKFKVNETTYHPLSPNVAHEKIILLFSSKSYDCLISKALSEQKLQEYDEIQLFENIDQAKKEREAVGQEESEDEDDLLDDLDEDIDQQDAVQSENQLEEKIEDEEFNEEIDMDLDNDNENDDNLQKNQSKKNKNHNKDKEKQNRQNDKELDDEIENEDLKEQEELNKQRIQSEIAQKQKEQEEAILLAAQQEEERKKEQQKREAEERQKEEELLKKKIEEERIQKEKAFQIEQERIKKENEEKDRLEKERLKKEADEAERLRHEQVVREAENKRRIEEEEQRKQKLEEEKRNQLRIQQENEEKERIKRQKEENDRLEQERLKQEAEEAERVKRLKAEKEAEEKKKREEEQQKQKLEDEKKNQLRIQKENEEKERQKQQQQQWNNRNAEEEQKQNSQYIEINLNSESNTNQSINKENQPSQNKPENQSSTNQRQSFTQNNQQQESAESLSKKKSNQPKQENTYWIYIAIGAAVLFGSIVIDKVKKNELQNSALSIIRSKL